MKHVLYAAVWAMIWLVLTIPVAVAEQVLTVQKFAGVDGVNGYAKEGDELTVQVLAQMLGNPTPDVARQRARVYHDDTFVFMDTCTAQQQAMYQCTYKTRDLVYGGTDDYTIKLFDAENTPIAEIAKTLTVDFLAPRIMLFSVAPNMTSTPVPTVVQYKVEDYGSETGKTTNCAGIKLINITANNTPVGMISTNVSTCSKNGTFTFTPQVQGPSTRLRVCITATDYVNHKSLPSCKDLLIDSRKPTADALELHDKDGFVATHMRSGQPFVVDVYAHIPDVDVNPSSVYADLSKLNPTLGKKPKDDRSNEWFIWRNIPVTTPSTCSVTVEAADLMGNKDTKTLPCTVGVDDTGPEPLSLSTQFVDDDNTPLLGTNGTIVAEFKESGTGLDKAQAFLDLRTLGLGAEVKAASCEKTNADTWTCLWNVKPTAESGLYRIKLLPTSRDDLNNQVTKTLNASVRFDKTAPGELRLIEIAAFRGQQRVRTNVTSLGETVEFVIQGFGFSTAIADLSALGGSKDTPAEHCEGNLTKNCTFGITVAVSGPQPTTVSFTVMDRAGNKASISTSALFILGINNETSPNYWSITTDCAPDVLDRATLSVFEHPVYCRLRMTSANANASPISTTGPLDISECTGMTDYISSLEVENNVAGSTEPYLALSLVPTDYKLNELTFTCPVSTLTRVGNFVAQNPEQDNATVTLKFYNLPLGELYDNIADEVHDVEDNLEGVWDVVGQLQKFLGYAEKLCVIMNTIMNLITTLTSLAALLSTIGLGVSWIPIYGQGIQKALDSVASSLCNPAEVMRKVYDFELLNLLKKFCDFITCQAGTFELLGVESGGQNWAYQWLSGEAIAGPAMQDVTKQLRGATAQEGEQVQNPNTYLNVKDSLIYSIVIPPLCIPGIIYNLDKWRQIECRYGLCLLEDVRQQGMPVSVCKDQKNYMQCRFVVGEIFHIIPFAAVADLYLKAYQQILSDPLVLVTTIVGKIVNCESQCKQGTSAGIWYNICAGMSVASQLGYTINQIRNIKTLSDFGGINSQWCDKFEDALDEFEEEEQAANEPGTVVGV